MIGAAAIEYALIGTLIGIGLIGSLLTTKSSLNGIFGVASSNLAGDMPVSARAGFWQSKTLSSAPAKSVNGARTTWSYTYTDGTTAVWQTGLGYSSYDSQLTVYDPATRSTTQSYFLKSGAMNFVYYLATANGNRDYDYETDIGQDPPRTMIIDDYDANNGGVFLKQTMGVTATQTAIDTFNRGRQDGIYFSGSSK